MAKKVLIVDDEVSIHTSLEYIFKQYGAEVLHATTGKDAIKIVTENKPDLIFMDFKLPGLNGILVTKEIKSNAALAGTPIIGITAYASDDNIRIAKSNGIETVLEKPFDLSELHKLIYRYL